MSDPKIPARSLREHPDLHQLKRQAKELLAAFRAGDADAVDEVTLSLSRRRRGHVRAARRAARAGARLWIRELAEAEGVRRRRHGVAPDRGRPRRRHAHASRPCSRRVPRSSTWMRPLRATSIARCTMPCSRATRRNGPPADGARRRRAHRDLSASRADHAAWRSPPNAATTRSPPSSGRPKRSADHVNRTLRVGVDASAAA